ncbi:hypothetical protein LGL55_19845 [Clostridium tagluense]|uniref:hypothetical protein n=1 Tax=Clostridium tagluense TaxID=360422 RepID=UPI001CF495CC|nr:hypothetical protein [Clostridium tagluense]MCB2313380.1 hypothetical protein [Clostridium tagluense]MCB2318204.1 hypothetical protein [Clostridium tagluense]MCB2322970.1 hypothetical protein [Clostridium tagluense]MCB2327988.1 hypothetical protein [Clostridium tagluense]MCB2332672.1 hypothetical protein [Clostridium tagluense]
MDNELKIILDDFSGFMKTHFKNVSDIKDKNNFFYKDEIVNLIKYCNGNKHTIDQVLSKISKEFNAYDAFKATLLCCVCGTLVEFGGNQDIIISHIIEKLKEALICIVSAQTNQENDDKRKVYIYVSFQTIDYLIIAAMTMLVRNSLEREKFKNDKDIQLLINTISPESTKNIYYLEKIMELTDDLEMVVIHPHKKKGYKIRIDGVQNYFHFFTLLQGELIEKVSDELELDKTLLNRNAVDVARTEKMPDNLGNVDDKAIFSYYIWNALSLDKTLSKNIPLENWIYGELMPKNTPTIFDEIVILIGDTVLGGRTWEGSFFYPFHDALKSQVSIIAILSETEVEQWLNKIVQEKNEISESNKNIEKDEVIHSEIKVENTEKGFKKFFKSLFGKKDN